MIKVEDIKSVLSKIDFVKKSRNKLLDYSGWVFLKSNNDRLSIKVCDSNYQLSMTIPAEDTEVNTIVDSDLFVSLLAKFDCKDIYINQGVSTLDIISETSEYHLPLVYTDKKEINVISNIRDDTRVDFTCSGNELSSIFKINVKGIAQSIIADPIQRYTYVDEKGAITFSNNVYINNFKNCVGDPFSFLLSVAQARMLNIFDGIEKVHCVVSIPLCVDDYIYVIFSTNNIKLELITTDYESVLKFPTLKLRDIVNNSQTTHVYINRSNLEKALTRLTISNKGMVSKSLIYTKLIFDETHIELYNSMSKNKEKILYSNSINPIKYTAIVDFEDLLNQVKLGSSREIDISYGCGRAIVINGEVIQLIPEIEGDL